jgi:hypothetical protein
MGNASGVLRNSRVTFARRQKPSRSTKYLLGGEKTETTRSSRSRFTGLDARGRIRGEQNDRARLSVILR